jgi:hypothetical protein
MKFHFNGTYRNVLLIGKYAIKFPKIYSCKAFLKGCIQNISERQFYEYGEMIYNVPIRHLIAPSIYCAFMGLFQIQKRCSPNFKDLTDDEKQGFKGITTDTHKYNFGYYNDKLVCLDYA